MVYGEAVENSIRYIWHVGRADVRFKGPPHLHMLQAQGQAEYLVQVGREDAR